MTQDANPSPLAALNATLSAKLAVPTPIGYVESMKPPSASESFYAALDHVEATGSALLQTAEGYIHAAEGYVIHEIGAHTVQPVVSAPREVPAAQALPLALPGDILHVSEHAIFHAFMDVGDVIRRVYLNVRGLWVKA